MRYFFGQVSDFVEALDRRYRRGAAISLRDGGEAAAWSGRNKCTPDADPLTV